MSASARDAVTPGLHEKMNLQRFVQSVRVLTGINLRRVDN